MLGHRVVLLTGGINDAVANAVVCRLLYLELQSQSKPILLIISSDGGQLYGGFAVYDTIRLLSAPVHTLCLGRAESMAAVLLAAGKPGHRYIAPNARVMIYQPSWTVESFNPGKKHAAEVGVDASEAHAAQRRYAEALAECCCGAERGVDAAQVERAMAHSTFMDAQEAVAFGLADRIVTSVAELMGGTLGTGGSNGGTGKLPEEPMVFEEPPLKAIGQPAVDAHIAHEVRGPRRRRQAREAPTAEPEAEPALGEPAST